MVFGFFGISVRYTVKTDYDTENRTSEIQKPKPNRTTEKTEISVRFGTVRFGFRFMVKKCPPLATTAHAPTGSALRAPAPSPPPPCAPAPSDRFTHDAQAASVAS
jgi:hypothetical protein